jgi:hypothetical protein
MLMAKAQIGAVAPRAKKWTHEKPCALEFVRYSSVAYVYTGTTIWFRLIKMLVCCGRRDCIIIVRRHIAVDVIIAGSCVHVLRGILVG